MTYKNQEYFADQVLSEILAHDTVIKKFETEVTQAQSRASKCRALADGYFKSRQMHPVTSDVKALAMLLYRVTSPKPPGRPRKNRSGE